MKKSNTQCIDKPKHIIKNIKKRMESIFFEYNRYYDNGVVRFDAEKITSYDIVRLYHNDGITERAVERAIYEYNRENNTSYEVDKRDIAKVQHMPQNVISEVLQQKKLNVNNVNNANNKTCSQHEFKVADEKLNLDALKLALHNYNEKNNRKYKLDFGLKLRVVHPKSKTHRVVYAKMLKC